MFKVKYVDSIMMLVRLNLNLIVSLFQHKCEVSETVSTTTLVLMVVHYSLPTTVGKSNFPSVMWYREICKRYIVKATVHIWLNVY